MITAKEAKTITDNCTYDKSKYYLTALNRNIKTIYRRFFEKNYY